MNGFISFIVNDFLTQPVILIGLLICIGYIMNKESITKVITGTLSAMVGIQMVIFGGGQFTSIFKPITTAVSNSFGIQGYIMDSYAIEGHNSGSLGQSVWSCRLCIPDRFRSESGACLFWPFYKSKGYLPYR